MGNRSICKNREDRMLFANVCAVILVGAVLVIPMGLAGIIDFVQIICTCMLMAVEMAGIFLMKKPGMQQYGIEEHCQGKYCVMPYLGITAGLISMMISLGNFRRLYGTMRPIFFRISLISLFWGLVLSMMTMLIQGKYVTRIQKTVGTCLAYVRLRREKQLRRSVDMLLDSINGPESEREAERLNKETKTLRHDMKNQMNILQALLEQGEYGKAQEYLGRYYGALQASGEESCGCKNEVLDILVKNAKGACKKSGILFYAAVCDDIPEELSLDLCILAGNALDNAIEGCSGEKRQIVLDIRRMENFLLIDVRNTIGTSVLLCNPGLATTKKDRALHGMGISSMKKLVSKYCGSIEFMEEAGFFVCSILLDLEMDKK